MSGVSTIFIIRSVDVMRGVSGVRTVSVVVRIGGASADAVSLYRRHLCHPIEPAASLERLVPRICEDVEHLADGVARECKRLRNRLGPRRSSLTEQVDVALLHGCDR